MKVEIDPYAGFCFGVEQAIQHAEVELAKQDSLLCLGEIVHNSEEVRRLEKKGFKTIGQSEFSKLKNKTVLIRAHGEPPETYALAEKNNLTLVEATCPVVLKLQKKVHNAWLEMKKAGGTVIIAGKKGHPEVIGLTGQAGHQALVVENEHDLNSIDFSKPLRIFAQTTLDKEMYTRMVEAIKARLEEKAGHGGFFKSYNSVCGQVSSRVPRLMDFCKHVDVVLLVSGKSSSNGKALFEACKTANNNSHFISSPDELKQEWFQKTDRVGISGATSTPRWLMEDIARKISHM